MKRLKFFGCLAFSMLLAGCGGSSLSNDDSTPPTDDTPPEQTISYSINLSLVEQSSGDVTSAIAVDNPGRLLVTLTDNSGVPQAGKIVSMSTTLGTIDPPSGEILTDDSGVAQLNVFADATTGAGTLTAQYDETTQDLAFEVVKANIQMGECATASGIADCSSFTSGSMETPLTGSLKANGTTSFTVTVVNSDGLPLTDLSVPVAFTSLCVDDNTAELDELVDTVDGIATSIYRANGCKGKDTIRASATIAGIELSARYDINVSGSFVINAELVEQGTGLPTTVISADKPGSLIIALTDEGGSPQANQLVTASTTIGELSPTNGTVLTDASGLAQLTIFAGVDTGAGQVTVIKEDASDAIAFQVGAANIRIGACDTSGDNVDCSGFVEGELENPLNGASLGAGQTTVFTATIVDSDGAPFVGTSSTVFFQSSCADAGQAIIDEQVQTINGVARSTYLAQGCEGNDTITATAESSGISLVAKSTISIDGSPAGSIEFISAEPKVIALKGTGGVGRSETSEVTFKVVDENGVPKANQNVTFTESTNVGELSLGQYEAQTNAEGLVKTIVRAGNVATSVIITATIDLDGDGETDLSSQSTELVVSTGLPDQNSFSLSADVLNPEAWARDGVEVNVTARLADHFNNPVPDGTAVTFSAEFGAVDSSCVTTNGACTVIWRSQAPRSPNPMFRGIDPKTGEVTTTKVIGSSCPHAPESETLGFPCPYTNETFATETESAEIGGLGQVYGNRVTIWAHTVGEESFTDSNGNGRFDADEAFSDMTEAFIDHNEDGVFGGKLMDGTPEIGASSATVGEAGTGIGPLCYKQRADLADLSCFAAGGDNEEFIDFNSNGEFDISDGRYNGTLCSESAEAEGKCTTDLVTVSTQVVILMSDSAAVIGTFAYQPDPLDPGNEDADIWTPKPSQLDLNRSKQTTIYVRVADLHNGRLPMGTEISAEWGNGEAVGPTSVTIGNSSSHDFTYAEFSAKADNEPSSGPLVISVTTPTEVVRSITINVID